MRIAKCICDEGGTISVQGPDFGRVFARGAVVDLDAPVVAGSSVTWGDALGKYAVLFAVEEIPASTRNLRRRSAPDAGADDKE